MTELEMEKLLLKMGLPITYLDDLSDPTSWMIDSQLVMDYAIDLGYTPIFDKRTHEFMFL